VFLNASALVAIITGEPEADVFADAIELAARPVTSPLAIYEAVLAIRRKKNSTVAEGLEDIRIFRATTGVEVISINEADAFAALETFARYGKGQGHPAQLNFGDCFAYAVAKNAGASLLFKGSDFSKTDIKQALPQAR
jgi:ribonuclease VapC